MTIFPQNVFEGLRVVDLTQGWAGPLSTMLLADLGAEVIKIEGPSRLDWWRAGSASKPSPDMSDRQAKQWERSPLYCGVNRNKLAVSIDMTLAAGRELFKDLVRISDVVIESFSPRVMRDWLLDYEHLKDVKDDLIMMSLPAVGVSGPWTHYVGYASTTEAISGMPALCGYEDGPRLQAPFVADPIGGLNGAAAISFALLHRESTGEGQFIEVAQYEGMVPFLGAALMETVLNGDVPARSPSGDTSFAPNGCYPCRGDDQWVVVCAPTEEEFVRLCEVIERPDLGGDDTLRRPADRAARRDFVDAAVAAWTSVRSPREAMKSLQDAGILAGAVNTAADVLDDPHIVSRESYIEIDREVVGSHPYPNVTTKLSETPGSVARPAPLFAEHNELVFGEMLGRTTDELLALRREGVIADEPVI